MPAAGGTASGQVRVLREVGDLDDARRGDVLVAVNAASRLRALLPPGAVAVVTHFGGDLWRAAHEPVAFRQLSRTAQLPVTCSRGNA